jgi:hypothetical protein
MAPSDRISLARLYEIVDGLARRKPKRHWLKDFEQGIAVDRLKLKHFLHIEEDLAGLDAAAWGYIKKEILGRSDRWNMERGWEEVLNIANEAKAYRYLKDLGCSDISFISRTKDHKTPDLQARHNGTLVLCEVKTLNILSDEANARQHSLARDIQLKLPEAFFKKMRSRFNDAAGQIDAFDAEAETRRIIFAVVNFDDNLNEYLSEHMHQIHAELMTWPAGDIEYVFDVKPRFYSATPLGPPGHRFVFAKDRIWRQIT